MNLEITIYCSFKYIPHENKKEKQYLKLLLFDILMIYNNI